MKDVQCYELFGGIALKNHAFSFFIFIANNESIHEKIGDFGNDAQRLPFS